MFAFLSRVLLFFAVISVLRSVVSAFLRAFRGGTDNPRGGNQARPPAADPVSPEGSTLLHQDPVCGTYVAAGSSLRRIVKGQVLHFCSEACRDRYRA